MDSRRTVRTGGERGWQVSYNPHEIPESMRRCMSKEVLKSLGIQTIDDTQESYNIRLEKDLLRLCMSELSRRGVRVVHHLSHRAREHAGYPDMTFCYAGLACACELKTAKGVVSADQEATMAAMRMDGWHVMVCRTFEAFRQWLDDVVENKEGGQ